MNHHDLEDYIGMLSEEDSIRLGSANLLLHAITAKQHPGYDQVFFRVNVFTHRPSDLPTSAEYVHQDFEMCYVLGGCVQYTVEGTAVQVPDNSMLLLGQGVEHVIERMKPGTRAVYIMIGREILDTPFMAMIERTSMIADVMRGQSNALLYSFGSDILAGFQLKLLCNAFFEPDAYSDMTTQLALMLFFLQLQRLADGTPPSKSGNMDSDIQSIARYIQQHYRTVTADEVAKRFGYTESYISKALKKHYGLSFVKFLNHQRLQAGASLLLSTNLTLTQIAERTGFSSASHFYRCFVNERGQTPQEYRTENQ